ncbi:MAG TPA: hypothetical protein PLE54_01850 [Burkholderiaceae bacterium]|nr:hypothetical protein [Burkholderiaceae bacterium]HQR69319.1 hypothetical protein [Burkholderiaceae bacterium]
MKLTRFTLAVVAAAATAVPLAAHAASSSQTGAGSINTTVNLNFSVTIPRYIFLRVGSAASLDTLTYAPTVAQMLASTPVQATGGDTGGGSDVTYQVFGNAGNMTLAASNLTQLTSGGNNIPSSTLSVTTQAGSVTAPAFNGSTALTASAAGIVNQTGSWRYVWTNPAATVYAAGTYTGTVTYTLSAP